MAHSDEAAIQHLFSLRTHGIKPGLTRISAAAKACGSPHTCCECIHVAGTNGKGSVCAFIESVLHTAGIRTGCFTSPHLCDFRERFRIDKKAVSTQQWLEVYRDLSSVIDDYGLTFFEASFLIATHLFKKENVEWTIYETGMGGRFDATNIVTPRISTITKIATDHQRYLGTSLSEIAREKLGIIKPGIPCVMQMPDDPTIRHQAHVAARKSDSPLYLCSVDSDRRPTLNTHNPGASEFTCKEVTYTLPAYAVYQKENASLAIETCSQLGIASTHDMQKGIAATRIPGRFQVLADRKPSVLLDGAHNPDAARMLISTIAHIFPDARICMVIGAMKDKDYSEMLRVLLHNADSCVYTAARSPRACAPEYLAQRHPYSHIAYYLTSSVPEALHQASQFDTDIICITGSLYIIGEAMNHLGIVPDTSS